MKRYAIELTDGILGYNDANPRLDIVYWVESNGDVSGEAYFHRDDLCAPISRGFFEHPYTGLKYKLHVPSRFGKSTQALLDVLTWKPVGRATPIEAPTTGG
jgi:hypothetical protein